MVVRYDTDKHGFVIDSGICEGCGEPMYDSGCDAPGCNGFGCQDCGLGCDIDFLPDEYSRWAAAIADEDPDDRLARDNEERGLRAAAAGQRRERGADMTGPDHFREAERLMREAAHDHEDGPYYLDEGGATLGAALVHATLAQVAIMMDSFRQQLPPVWDHLRREARGGDD